MIKLIGLFLIFLTCTAGGFVMASRLKRREKALRASLDGFAELERRIRCDACERDRLLYRAFDGKHLLDADGALIADCGLFSDDRRIITEFLLNFGNGNLTAEENRIRLTAGALERQYDTARSGAAEYGRLWITAGISGGLFGCIILL